MRERENDGWSRFGATLGQKLIETRIGKPPCANAKQSLNVVPAQLPVGPVLIAFVGFCARNLR
jgi:hypothetical protein